MRDMEDRTVRDTESAREIDTSADDAVKIGIVIATVIGTLVGISRLSSNWLLARLASAYVEVMRNIPLLLQLFVWYGLFTMLPGVRQSISAGEWLFLNQRGLRVAWPAPH